MTDHTSERTCIYDLFEGPDLDPGRWHPLVTPLEDGSEWIYAEPAAVTSVGAGEVDIDIPVFSRRHDSAQSPDNAKHLMMSVDAVPVPSEGRLVLSVEMAAVKHGGVPEDYRDGFITFNAFDLESLLVFDLVHTGSRPLAIYERLGVPGVVEGEDAFTYVADAPLAGVSSGPGVFHRYEIELDVEHAVVDFRVDGVLVYRVPVLPVVPRQLHLGMGLMTLAPIKNGRSTSIAGQGMRGRWRNLGYRVE